MTVYKENIFNKKKQYNTTMEPPIDIIPAILGAKAMKAYNEETLAFLRLPRLTGADRIQHKIGMDEWNDIVDHIERLEDRMAMLEATRV